MSPLEIGMYVLLAAFCFAIVVFVVSCVVYASKFKPQPPDFPLAGSALPVLSGAARAKAAANQLASGRRPPRESTTNAHDWVWLGRATLERAACGPQQVSLSPSHPLSLSPSVSSVSPLFLALRNRTAGKWKVFSLVGKSDQQPSGRRDGGRVERAGDLLRQSESHRATIGWTTQQRIRPGRYHHLLQEGQASAKQFREQACIQTIHGRVGNHGRYSTVHGYFLGYRYA